MARPLRVEFEDAIYHLCFAALARHMMRKPTNRELLKEMLNVKT